METGARANVAAVRCTLCEPEWRQPKCCFTGQSSWQQAVPHLEGLPCHQLLPCLLRCPSACTVHIHRRVRARWSSPLGRSRQLRSAADRESVTARDSKAPGWEPQPPRVRQQLEGFAANTQESALSSQPLLYVFVREPQEGTASWGADCAVITATEQDAERRAECSASAAAECLA